MSAYIESLAIKASFLTPGSNLAEHWQYCRHSSVCNMSCCDDVYMNHKNCLSWVPRVASWSIGR